MSVPCPHKQSGASTEVESVAHILPPYRLQTQVMLIGEEHHAAQVACRPVMHHIKPKCSLCKLVQTKHIVYRYTEVSDLFTGG